jgi:hypothetical protein
MLHLSRHLGRIGALALGLLAASAARAAEPSGAPPPPQAELASSVAFGAVGVGDVMWRAELGWLRSGIRADIGIGFDVDIALEVDAWLLHDFNNGQKQITALARYTPLSEGSIRLAFSAGAGEVFIGSGIESFDLFQVKGEITVGLSFAPYGTPYGRVAFRGLKFNHGLSYEGWGRDEEVGLGWEVKVWRVVVAVEGYFWLRPQLDSIPQGRVIVGVPF